MRCLHNIEETDTFEGLDENVYNNWYVLFVTTGKESLIKSVIEKYTQNTIKTIIFKKEIFHRKKGKKIKVTNTLFSGYVFIHEEIDIALNISRTYLCTERVMPISINKKPCKVHENEMMFLLGSSDKNGIFKVSKGKKKNNSIYITEGVLKNIQGNIVWIDEKKSKAGVEIPLFRRKIIVNLGLDIIQYVS